MASHGINPYLESQYNVASTRAGFEQVIEDWAKRSLAYRSKSAGFSQYAYGNREREVIDLYPAREKHAPVMVYLHGGYWQRGDRSLYGFLAEPLVKTGVNVAIVGYPLCPSASLRQIVDSVRNAIIWLWKNGHEQGMDPERMIVVGHSAGGHLATMVQATDWPAIDPSVAERPCSGVVAISGLYWLEPLRETALNELLQLSNDDVRWLSPVEKQPQTDVPVAAVVGSAETAEFFKQADRLEMRWKQYDVHIDRHVEPDADHFDIIYHLADPQSALFDLVSSYIEST